MGHVLLALLHRFGIGAGVVVALRQAESARAVEADDRLESAKSWFEPMTKNAFTPMVCRCASSAGNPSAELAVRRCGRVPVAIGVMPSLFTVAVSMQLAYSSPIFCSLGCAIADRRFEAVFENLLEVQAIQFEELCEAAVRCLVGGSGLRLNQPLQL